MISLLTHPNLTHTGFKIAVVNSKMPTQSVITRAVTLISANVNIVLYDLQLDPEHIDYTISAIMTSDLILYQNPDMRLWLTGFIVSLPHCYYLEQDVNTVNTLYKVSLRQLDESELTGIIEHAIQRKYGTTLQLLPEKAK